MILTQDEQATLDALVSNKKYIELIAKYMVRPFESLPTEFKNVPNESLGEIVKANLQARDLIAAYLREMKTDASKKPTEQAPIAPA